MPLTKPPASDSLNGDAGRVDAVVTAVKAQATTASPKAPTQARATAKKSVDSRARARTLAKQQQAAERIASATGELTHGIAEATEAAHLLENAVQEIASGAEEASSACEESLAAVDAITGQIGVQRGASERVRSLVSELQQIVGETRTGIEGLLVNIGSATERQEASVQTISELEKQAEEIGEIVKTVARIADQTNLLALNAAIEAARARQHGKGFAVVADEVRTLAETSEKSATEIRTLIDDIRTAVTAVAEGVGKSAETARGEVEKGRQVTDQLELIRKDMIALLDGATEIATAADQAGTAVAIAQKGAQEIAAASEEQSAACEESLQAVGQETAALQQSETTADELAEIADELRASSDISKSAESVASSAEELSSAVEEISGAAGQILAGVDQMRDGARTAATRAEQAAAGLGQIETAAELARDRAKAATELAESMASQLEENKSAVDGMITSIGTSAEAARDAGRQVAELEQISRRIDKIVDAISTVSIQTNMLAVNGSVESARAGEFGKGFAVVSTDIRNLARDSADNAEQIKDLVKTVQDRIVEVRGDLDETSRLALAEVERAKETTTRLEQMARDMVQVKSSGEEVLTSSGEIAVATGQAKKGIDQIATAALEAEKLSEQAAGAANEQRQAAEQLAEAIEEIAALADELQTL
ncbi:MAG: methyl-accepting chemotaxis protein [Solirubrobacteraceae bacterium]